MQLRVQLLAPGSTKTGSLEWMIGHWTWQGQPEEAALVTYTMSTNGNSGMYAMDNTRMAAAQLALTMLPSNGFMQHQARFGRRRSRTRRDAHALLLLGSPDWAS